MNEKFTKPVFNTSVNWSIKVALLILVLTITFLNTYSSVNYISTPHTNFDVITDVVRGNVTDKDGEPLPGVNVIIKGTKTGTITDINGDFTLSVENKDVLVFSYIGYITKEIRVGLSKTLNVILLEDVKSLDELVVIGYGQQKKQSLVGAIQQVDNKDLRKTMGNANLAQALTGRLPGVTTIISTGEPGNDDPLIYIRGQSTWNNAQPLILVDGIERKMNDIDVSEVESISVLKDASATAVFGVKGAEGVILITTKRGIKGKAKLSFSANHGIKLISRVPSKLNSFDALSYRNNGIENELPVFETGWASYIPTSILDRYKEPQQPGDEYIFPNVDWGDEMTKDFAHTTQINLNISGGTDFAKYFSSISYIYDGDILASGKDLGLGYKTRWGYDRFNYRINLDLNLTPSTILSTNLSGYVGSKYESYFTEDSHNSLFTAFYSLAPSAFPVMHEDGTWGMNATNSNEGNPVKALNTHGLEKIVRSQVMTDFRITQKLDFITPGLNFQASLSYDNLIVSSGGTFQNGTGRSKWIDPNIINMTPEESIDDYIYLSNEGERFDYRDGVPIYQAEGIRLEDYWRTNNNLQATQRRLFYQLQLNYNRLINRHNIGATAVMNREQYTQGSMFPSYREDWVGRITYSFENKYLFETNAAYNGSEKFGKGYRFGFFPSLAVGWVASNEKFLDYKWLSNLKFRYSIGKVGNDSFNSPRFAYETVWNIADDRPPFGYPTQGTSPYPAYGETVIGNPDLHWEISKKQNLGIEISILKNMFNLNVDLFRDDRSNIFMNSSQRSIPAYFGQNPVAANLGKTETKGYEIDFTYRNTFKNDLYYWFNWSYTHAKDKIIYMEDPELLPSYQKNAGFQIGQNRSLLDSGYLNNWDDVYGSTYNSTSNNYKLPGDLRIVDYNGDGQIDSYDIVPYGYPSRPQNTFNFSFGAEYKGISAQLQFYGVNNVTRQMTNIYPYSDRLEQLVFEFQSDYWSPINMDAEMKAPRFRTTSSDGAKYFVDGSYLRLKTVEVAYTFDKKLFKNLFESLRIYLNGNNLFFWSDMVDDREDNSGRVPYPTMKRITMGIDIQF